MKSRESLIVLIILLSIIALGIWRAISLSVAHPHLMDFKNEFVPLNPNPNYSTTTNPY